MTNPELSAAVERYRNGSEDWQDLHVLARAYLSTVAADDGEAIDGAWLNSTCDCIEDFAQCRGIKGSDHQVAIWCGGEQGQSSEGADRLQGSV